MRYQCDSDLIHDQVGINLFFCHYQPVKITIYACSPESIDLKSRATCCGHKYRQTITRLIVRITSLLDITSALLWASDPYFPATACTNSYPIAHLAYLSDSSFYLTPQMMYAHLPTTFLTTSPLLTLILAAAPYRGFDSFSLIYLFVSFTRP